MEHNRSPQEGGGVEGWEGGAEQLVSQRAGERGDTQ